MTRVFVTGTGRCGTVTFAKACEHVHGFTVGHETRKREDLICPVYPDQHIEVDPHLVWAIPELRRMYPDALWFILDRETGPLVASIATRRTIPAWARLAYNGVGIPPSVAAIRFVTFVRGAVRAMLPEAPILTTPVTPSAWALFLETIGATADPEALDVLRTVHNAGGVA